MSICLRRIRWLPLVAVGWKTRRSLSYSPLCCATRPTATGSIGSRRLVLCGRHSRVIHASDGNLSARSCAPTYQPRLLANLIGKMKPLALHGHERSITKICYNTDGDLLFSSSKDATPCVWWSINGERLGTFEGHNGAVWCIDCNWDTTRVATGSADQTLRIWDCETGKCLNSVKTTTSVRSALFSYSGKLILYTTDAMMKQQPEINVIDITSGEHLSGESALLKIKLDAEQTKALSPLWGACDESLITGHESGNIVSWDLRNGGEIINEVKVHKSQINDLQYNKDQTLFVSASKDNTAKLFDAYTLEHMKTFPTDRPVNSAAISPIFDHVVIGGGQEAMEVTTTAAESGKFESRFFHLIFEEEFGRVKGHFGPIQSLAFHPDGRSFASGGEDGYVRVQSFDDSYFNFKMEYE